MEPDSVDAGGAVTFRSLVANRWQPRTMISDDGNPEQTQLSALRCKDQRNSSALYHENIQTSEQRVYTRFSPEPSDNLVGGGVEKLSRASIKCHCSKRSLLTGCGRQAAADASVIETWHCCRPTSSAAARMSCPFSLLRLVQFFFCVLPTCTVCYHYSLQLFIIHYSTVRMSMTKSGLASVYCV